jgi:hypothetical protein
MAIAEDTRARRLAGDPSVTLDDLVRVDSAARRAVRDLGIRPNVAPPGPTLTEYLAELAAKKAAQGAPAAVACVEGASAPLPGGGGAKDASGASLCGPGGGNG